MKYSIYTSFTRFSALNIDNIGISDDMNITRFGPGQRSSYIIFYVTNGKGYFNGHLIKKGQGFIHISKMPEEYHADPNDPWTLLWFTSDDSAMGTMVKHFHADKETSIFDCDLSPVMPELFETFKNKNHSILNRAEMLEIFMSVFKIHLPKPNGRRYENSERVYVDSAVNYIQTNYHLNINVSDITSLLGISQPYLYRMFKTFFNNSPKEYIIRYRIEQAKKLLDETNLPISTIATNVGYSDTFAFSKIFTKKVGQSPKNYRIRRLR